MTRNARSFGNSGWDDWGDEGSRPTKVSLPVDKPACKGTCDGSSSQSTGLYNGQSSLLAVLRKVAVDNLWPAEYLLDVAVLQLSELYFQRWGLQRQQ